MEAHYSEFEAKHRVEQILADLSRKAGRNFGLAKFAGDFMLFDFPFGSHVENLETNHSLYSLIYEKSVTVSSLSGPDTVLARKIWEKEDGEILLRTTSGHALWSNFKHMGKHWDLEVKVDAREQGGVSWLEILKRDSKNTGYVCKKMDELMAAITLLSGFEADQTTLHLIGKGKSIKDAEFKIGFTEPNPMEFPAISFSLMQKNGKVYASTGPDIKDFLITLNSKSGSHTKLAEYFMSLKTKGGFGESNNLATGKYFSQSWFRVG